VHATLNGILDAAIAGNALQLSSTGSIRKISLANGVRRRLAWCTALARGSPYAFNAAVLGVLVGSAASSIITADPERVVRLV
jgi:hypothetical protein